MYWWKLGLALPKHWQEDRIKISRFKNTSAFVIALSPKNLLTLTILIFSLFVYTFFLFLVSALFSLEVAHFPRPVAANGGGEREERRRIEVEVRDFIPFERRFGGWTGTLAGRWLESSAAYFFSSGGDFHLMSGVVASIAWMGTWAALEKFGSTVKTVFSWICGSIVNWDKTGSMILSSWTRL